MKWVPNLLYGILTLFIFIGASSANDQVNREYRELFITLIDHSINGTPELTIGSGRRFRAAMLCWEEMQSRTQIMKKGVQNYYILVNENENIITVLFSPTSIKLKDKYPQLFTKDGSDKYNPDAKGPAHSIYAQCQVNKKKLIVDSFEVVE